MKNMGKKVLALLFALLLIVGSVPLYVSAGGSVAYEIYGGGVAVYTYYSGAVSSVQFPTWTDYNGQDDLI